MGDTWQMSFEHEAGSSYDGGDERLRLSDLGKLARRSRRRVVRAARADDRPTFAGLLTAHLGETDELDVVEESWPGYDHVNVQVALDAWLAEPGRSHELVGMARFRHTGFGLGGPDAAAGRRRVRADPGQRLAHEPAERTGRSGAAGRAGRAVPGDRDGDTRAAILVLGGDPEEGSTELRLHLVADRPGAAAEIASLIRALAVEHNVFRGQVISFGSDMFGERRRSCSSTSGRGSPPTT